MKVVVTQAHIDAGRPNDGCGCPIARAVKAATGKFVFVEGEVVEVGLHRMHPLPPAARAFVDAFDHGKPVEPFELELPL